MKMESRLQCPPFNYLSMFVFNRMANNSRQSRMSNKDEQFTFSWKLFTDWDYMVGNPETATTKHASIVTTMKVSMDSLYQR